MKRGHDRLAVHFFGHHRLGVDRNIANVARHAKEKQAQSQQNRAGGQREHDHGDGIHGRGKVHDLFATVFTGQIPRKWHGEQLTRRQCKQDRAHGTVGELQGRFDVGNAAGPGGKTQPLKEIKSRYRPPHPFSGGLDIGGQAFVYELIIDVHGLRFPQNYHKSTGFMMYSQ